MRLILSVATAIAALIAIPAQAAEKCYKDVPVAAGWSCAGNDSKSADFTNGCKFVAAHTEAVEVECPVTARWVNSNNAASSPETVCGTYGLKPTNINGQVCASGANRPSTGAGWNGINYYNGTWTGSGSNVGGYGVSKTTQQSNGSTNGSGGNSKITYYACLGAAGGNQDQQAATYQQITAVAYACAG